MDRETINKLAKAHATLISTYSGLSYEEQLLVASIVVSILAGSVTVQTEASPTPIAKPEPESDKANALGTGAILMPRGSKAYCLSCDQYIYDIVTDVRARNMGTRAFLEAYRPIGGAPPLSRGMLEEVLRDTYGNALIDCPVCRGDKSLAIVGKGERTAADVNISAPVTSIGGSEYAGI